jgi:hypothetical protein
MEQVPPNPNTSLFQLNLDANNSYTLRSAASWAKVLGIVGIIIGILCVILGLLVQSALSRIGDTRYNDIGPSASMIGNYGMIAYIVFGLVFLISSIFAINAGNKISRALRTNDQHTLNAGFAGVRNYFAFWAILMIIFLILILISIAGSLGR